MQAKEIRKKFLEFFKSKGHVIVSSSSLIPDDPSVLLTTAGMQQFKKYYTGELDPMKAFDSHRTTSVQKSFRTSDIDEVGDERHLTFFEMLGNFSFGPVGSDDPNDLGTSGYFKRSAITWAHEFITKTMDLKISCVTIFKGSHGVPKDEESRSIWNSLGVSDVREEGIEDVFWGPTGSEGPCGPTTEIYCKNAEGRDIEIWNIVFNQFYYPGSREELLSEVPGKALCALPNPGVDTGMGLERLAMIAQNTATIFETDLFTPLTVLLPKTNERTPESTSEFYGGVPPRILGRTLRIIADHMRASVFLIHDGVTPSNTERGYILRSLLRRVITHFKLLNLDEGVAEKLVEAVFKEYGEFYELKDKTHVLSVLKKEFEDFGKAFQKGMREFDKFQGNVSGKQAFDLHQNFGFRIELMRDLARERGLTLDEAGFREEYKKHQEISRAGQEKKFGGHGLILDTGELKAANEEELEKVTRLHTATHMLQQALRTVLGDHVHQAGSDITAERLRFDFTHPEKMTPEQIKEVENLINTQIERGLEVQFIEKPFEEAVSGGALAFFKQKYPETVKVYSVGDFSKEVCGGPHVKTTKTMGKFKIVKEESSSKGVRRIRAILTDES